MARRRVDRSINIVEDEKTDISNESELEKDVTRIYEDLVKTDTKLFDVDDDIDNDEDMDNDADDDFNTTKELDVVEDKKLRRKRERILSSNNDFEEQMIMDVADSSKRKVKNLNQSKKNFKVIIFILLMLVIIVGLVIVGVWFQRFSNEKNNEKYNKLSKLELQDIVDDYGKELEKALKSYLSKSKESLTYDELILMIDNEYSINCDVYDLYDDGSIYLDKCRVEDEKGLFSYGEEREKIVIDANTVLKVYVDNSSGDVFFEKPIGGKGYTTYEVHCGENYSKPRLFGAGMDFVMYYSASNNIKIVNFKTNDKALPMVDYQEIMPIKIGDDLFDNNYVAVKVNDFFGIYNIVDGKQIISPTYVSFQKNNMSFVETLANNLIVASDGVNRGVINYVSGKIVIPFEYANYNMMGNYIYASNDKNMAVFDINGNRYLSQYTSIDAIYGDKYFLASINENKKLVQIDGKILYDYGIIDNIGSFLDSGVDGSNIVFNFYTVNDMTKCISIRYNKDKNQGDYVEYDCTKE